MINGRHGRLARHLGHRLVRLGMGPLDEARAEDVVYLVHDADQAMAKVPS